MTINQHNYGEFFLLYADGELCAADRLAVDRFAQENPDLAEELVMLIQLRLPDEPLIFADKDLLYRNGSTDINLDNYEENFLLYVDNELAKDAKQQVETFVLQHPNLQEDFTLLKQTHLNPELISFPHKELLFRKEEKKRPVFYLSWQRVAVAAAFIGLAVMVWLVIPGNKNAPQLILAKQMPVSKLNNPGQLAAVTEQKNEVHINKIAETTTANNIIANAPRKSTPLINTRNDQPKNRAVENKNRPDLAAANQDQTIPVVSPHKVNTIDEKNEVAEVSPPTQQPAADKNYLSSADMVKAKKPDENSIAGLAKPAVYKELDTEDEKKSLYLGSIEINKDKLRGFFRKAGSIFRGKTRQQEEERPETVPSNIRSLK